MMCTFGEFWWVFLFVGVISALIIIALPSDAPKAGLILRAICLVSLVLFIIAGSVKQDLRCKELKYQSVLDKRPELVQECPDRDNPGCQIKWIKYQRDSLNKYLRVLQ